VRSLGPSAKHMRSVSRRGNEMAKGREKSDGRVVPKGRRKAVQIAAFGRGGKATTASEEAGQLRLSFGTADSPRGAAGGVEEGGPSASARRWTTSTLERQRPEEPDVRPTSPVL
jgi:hypothetical protein